MLHALTNTASAFQGASERDVTLLSQRLDATMPYVLWTKMAIGHFAASEQDELIVMQTPQPTQLAAILESSALDSQTLALEKYGVSCDVRVEIDESCDDTSNQVFATPALLKFAGREIIKNAVGISTRNDRHRIISHLADTGAMYRRHKLDTDLEEAVRVKVYPDCIKINDKGVISCSV